MNSVSQTLPVSLPSKTDIETLLSVSKSSDGEISLRRHHVRNVCWSSNVTESGTVVEELGVSFFCRTRGGKKKVR